jgi:N-acyl-D-amino-acid deacylase
MIASGRSPSRLPRTGRLLLALGMVVVSAVGVGRADDAPIDAKCVRKVLKRSVLLLQKSAATYIEKKDCFSCHHQALPAIAVARAKRAGLSVDAELTGEQSDFTHEYFGGRAKRVRVGEGVPGGPYNAGYALWGLHADGRKPDSVTNDLVAYLKTKHRRDGSWRIRTHRPPLEDSDFTATALSLRGLQLYGGKAGAKDLAERIPRTQNWLLKTEAKTNEDRVFRLVGLVWAGGKSDDLERLAKELIKQQLPDGGWRQLAEGTSDSYATGQVLFALKTAGIKVGHRSYQDGCRFLLKTVQPDGSWLVTTRSKAIQTYFESGFPYEKSQFISICGTCWATLALVELLPVTAD